MFKKIFKIDGGGKSFGAIVFQTLHFKINLKAKIKLKFVYST